jgi:hypothetical protein
MVKGKLISLFAFIGVIAYVIWMINHPAISKAWSELVSAIVDLLVAHVNSF